MLGKLFKYEFKNTAKVMLTIYGVLLLTTIIGTFALRGAVRMEVTGNDSPIANLLFATALIVYILSIFAFFIVTYVYMCTHFYKTMYSAQGYLTHTLPVKRLTTFHVKLATSFIWIFFSILLFIASIFLLVNGAVGGELWSLLSTEIWKDFGRELAAMGISRAGFVLYAIAIIVLSCLSYLLWVFASASIGQLFSTNKVLVSVVAGVIIYFINQVMSLVVMTICGLFASASVSGSIFSVTATTVSGTTSKLQNAFLGGQMIYSVLVVIVLYVICNVIVRKHVNLE